MPMTRTVAPRVMGRVIMKMSAAASGLIAPSSMLRPRTMATKTTRHTQAIAMTLEIRFVAGISQPLFSRFLIGRTDRHQQNTLFKYTAAHLIPSWSTTVTLTAQGPV